MAQQDKGQNRGVEASAGRGRVDIKRVSGYRKAGGSYPPTDLQNWMRAVYRRLAQAETPEKDG